MTSQWRHVSVSVERPAAEVYDYARDPAHLTDWAQGLGGAVHELDGQWFAETPGGRVGVAFVARNEHGVLDHDVSLPDGNTLRVPMRVIPDGDDCLVVFHVQRPPDAGDDDFDRDAAAVTADLAALKRVLETS